VQLTLLGYVLLPIFQLKEPWLILALGCAMVFMAAREAIRRAGRRYRDGQLNTTFALFVAASVTTLMSTRFVINVEPWWEPRYAIPLVGMVLGNALTGVTLGLDRCLSELDEGRSRVELLLAFGATRWEAARPVVVEALRTGMIPILNSMSVVGLVTIPGMMTGQLLGGTRPELAARYQILIMFVVASATAIGAGLSILLCVRSLFDRDHRLLADGISKSDG
jgi:putative ABC transport system permease protein